MHAADHPSDHPAADAQYCSARTICQRLEISRSTLSRLMRRGAFPPPALGLPGEKQTQILRWRVSDVDQYLRDVEAATAAKAQAAT